MAAVLAEFFAAHTFRVEITVAVAALNDLVVVRLKPDFLPHLAKQRLLERFPAIHATLRKLPGAGNRPALANQQISL